MHARANVRSIDWGSSKNVFDDLRISEESEVRGKQIIHACARKYALCVGTHDVSLFRGLLLVSS